MSVALPESGPTPQTLEEAQGYLIKVRDAHTRTAAALATLRRTREEAARQVTELQASEELAEDEAAHADLWRRAEAIRRDTLAPADVNIPPTEQALALLDERWALNTG